MKLPLIIKKCPKCGEPIHIEKYKKKVVCNQCKTEYEVIRQVKKVLLWLTLSYLFYILFSELLLPYIGGVLSKLVTIIIFLIPSAIYITSKCIILKEV